MFSLVYYRSATSPLFSDFSDFRLTRCLKDPTCATFLKSMGFKDIKYDIPGFHKYHEGHEYKNTKCSNEPTCVKNFEMQGVRG